MAYSVGMGENKGYTDGYGAGPLDLEEKSLDGRSVEGLMKFGKVMTIALLVLGLASSAAMLGCGIAFGITPLLALGAVGIILNIGVITLLGCCCSSKKVEYEHVS